MTTGKPKPLGVLLGVAGSAMLALGIYKLAQTGSCGGAGLPPCPIEDIPYMLLMPLGIVLTVVAAFVGGGYYTFTLTFLAIGVGGLASGLVGDGDLAFALLFGGIFTMTALSMLVIVPVMKAFGSNKAAQAAQLVATGGRAIGTLLDVQDTGVTVNNNPRVRLRMRIEPQDGTPAFEGEKTLTVSRVDLPRVGASYPVWYDRGDHSKWGYGTRHDATASPDVKALFEAAQAASAQAGVAYNAPSAPAAPPAPASGPLEQIAQLNELRMRGAVSDEEFEAAKDRLLAQLGGAGAPSA